MVTSIKVLNSNPGRRSGPHPALQPRHAIPTRAGQDFSFRRSRAESIPQRKHHLVRSSQAVVGSFFLCSIRVTFVASFCTDSKLWKCLFCSCRRREIKNRKLACLRDVQLQLRCPRATQGSAMLGPWHQHRPSSRHTR